MIKWPLYLATAILQHGTEEQVTCLMLRPAPLQSNEAFIGAVEFIGASWEPCAFANTSGPNVSSIVTTAVSLLQGEHPKHAKWMEYK